MAFGQEPRYSEAEMLMRSQSDEEDIEERSNNRGNNINWCKCTQCAPMPTNRECTSCVEIRKLKNGLDATFNPDDYVFDEDEELWQEHAEYFAEGYSADPEYWSEDPNSYSNYSYFYEDSQPSTEVNYSCDTCEKEFWSKGYYEKHMSEHITCKLDGCTFTAHEKIVEKHIRMQHSTGLYDKIKKLDTPEDIAKWIEERKKNYPNKENIEKRYAQQMEKIANGERIQKNDNRFGRDKYRWGKNQPPPGSKANTRSKKLKQKPKPFRKVSLIEEKANWNGTMFPFLGTLDLFREQSDEVRSDFEDDEWQENTKKGPGKVKQPFVKLNNALGALMGAYGSDTEEEMEITPIQNIESRVEETKKLLVVNSQHDKIGKLSDDEPPDEIKIDKEAPPESEVRDEMQKIKNSEKVDKNTLKRQRKRKRPIKKEKAEKSKIGPVFNQSSESLPNKTFRRRKVTLLEKLLTSEIREERNLLLQCVRYTVQNNYFQS